MGVQVPPLTPTFCERAVNTDTYSFFRHLQYLPRQTYRFPQIQSQVTVLIRYFQETKQIRKSREKARTLKGTFLVLNCVYLEEKIRSS